jgi:enamine deaminase RidA (YjgF/YER057c/UK114 family)
MRRLISSGSPFEAAIGYPRAAVDGPWIFVSGTTGFDYRPMTISEDVAEQAEQALRTIGEALSEAGSSYADVVRVRYILPKSWKACGPTAIATPQPTPRRIWAPRSTASKASSKSPRPREARGRVLAPRPPGSKPPIPGSARGR